MNKDLMFRLGYALGTYLRERRNEPVDASGNTGKVLIGRDTRASGEMLATALAKGMVHSRIVVESLGVLPSPALCASTRETDADLGLMLTASHNPAADNGVKIFNSEGYKFHEEEERIIEELIDGSAQMQPADTENVRGPDFSTECSWAKSRYIDSLREMLPECCAQGWNMVLDNAHGATAFTSPEVLTSLGAEVTLLATEPNGTNINDGVGSEYPERMADMVKTTGAHLGIAHDGDGDRLVLCDETGSILDGDEVLGLLAVNALQNGNLAHGTMVATVMSNLGLDAALNQAGGRVERVAVGDRNVVTRMAANGYQLGGESSGHIVFADHGTSGDGLLAALKVIEAMIEQGRPLSELRRSVTLFPQMKCNLSVREKVPLGDLPELTTTVDNLRKKMGSEGRFLLRYSGTEDMIRLLVEGRKLEKVDKWMESLKGAVRAHVVVG